MASLRTESAYWTRQSRTKVLLASCVMSWMPSWRATVSDWSRLSTSQRGGTPKLVAEILVNSLYKIFRLCSSSFPELLLSKLSNMSSISLGQLILSCCKTFDSRVHNPWLDNRFDQRHHLSITSSLCFASLFRAESLSSILAGRDLLFFCCPAIFAIGTSTAELTILDTARGRISPARGRGPGRLH